MQRFQNFTQESFGSRQVGRALSALSQLMEFSEVDEPMQLL
jgi:hypothetical protein